MIALNEVLGLVSLIMAILLGWIINGILRNGEKNREIPREGEGFFWKPSHDPRFDSERFYFPFIEETKTFKMGIKTLPDDRDWIEIDSTYLDHFQLRKKIFATKMTEIFRSESQESTRIAKQEVLDMLVSHLIKRFPSIFELQVLYFSSIMD